MKEIFEKQQELNSMVTIFKSKCEIISNDVNSVMQTISKAEDEGMSTDKFLARRYLELAEELAKYGIIEKEW